MTGGYSLIVPMMIVSSLSYLPGWKGVVVSEAGPKSEIVKLPAHIGDFVVDIMDRLTIRSAVARDRKAEVIPESMPFERILKVILGLKPARFPGC